VPGLLALLTLLAVSHASRIPAAAQTGMDLAVSIHLTGGVVTSSAGLLVTIASVTTTNNGVVQAPASTTRFHLVPANPVDFSKAMALADRAVPALDPGASDVGGPIVLTLPVTGGTFQIVAQADANNAVAEDNEGNNFSLPTRNLVVGPDLVVFLSIRDEGATVRDRTRNRATNSTAVGPSTTSFFLSADAILDAGDIPVGSRGIPALGPRAVENGQPFDSAGDTPLNLPAGLAAGTYHVIGVADADGAHVESDDANNVSISEPVSFLPDLVIASTTLPRKALAGETISVTDETASRGVAQAPASSTGYWLSRDTVLDASDVLLGTRPLPPLNGGTSDPGSTTAVIPPDTQPGCYFLITSADAGGLVAESNDSNNAARARAIQIRPPDGVKLLCAHGDFNGDRRSDVLWRHDSGDVAVWLMNGASLAGAATVASASSDWIVAAVGDFSGDGKADIVWRNSLSGDIALWVMDGTSLARTFTLPNPSLNWTLLGVGDFDGDGRLDVLWQETTSGAVAIWLMDGISLGGAAIVASLPLTWTIGGVGDFDGDGNADIAWRDSASGAVAIWLMDGVNLLGGTIVDSPPLDWAIAGVGDFDGDDKADILWRQSSSGTVAMWLMDGTSLRASAIVENPTLDWTIQGLGDLDGDGRLDVVWRDAAGVVAVWSMNGTAIADRRVVPEGVGLEWTIQ
jgi:hypothetical protein